MIYKLVFLMTSFMPLVFCSASEKLQEEVLTYWFGDPQEEGVSSDRSKLWFGGGPALDLEISERFKPALQESLQHKLDTWKQTPKGRLALIVLIDQFSRNIFRGKPQAFEADFLAQKLSLEGMELGDDLKLSPLERVFFYLPLEHAEDLQLQELSVKAFRKLSESVSASVRPTFESFLDYALVHHAIVEKFGRFPHRNDILKRASTPEELEFLKGPNSSF